MRTTPLFAAAFILGLTAGCAGQSATKPVEVLDERTGMTLAALEEPIELLPNLQGTTFAAGKRATFAYLGPVEWDRMGAYSYGLWVHIAPGNDRQPGDIHGVGAVTLILDDGPLTLSLMDPPKLGRDAYHPMVSWGQAAYFDLNVDTLKRMAASTKLSLDVRGADGSTMNFIPSSDTRTVLTRYVRARGITLD